MNRVLKMAATNFPTKGFSPGHHMRTEPREVACKACGRTVASSNKMQKDTCGSRCCKLIWAKRRNRPDKTVCVECQAEPRDGGVLCSGCRAVVVAALEAAGGAA
mgnify:CR=1 FL=1